MHTKWRFYAAALAIAGTVALGVGPALAQKYGKPGDPVKLTVGYQPYYTQSWSGVVINGLELWKKHLPKGSEVEFQVGLQGAVIVGQMLADKQQIGYMGDMPSLVATNRVEVADVRLVAVLGLSEQQCNIFLVRNDAPKFANGKDVVKWMNDKIVSSPHGSCTDRFARAVFQKEGVKPSQYLNQNIEVITTNFKAGKLDAAVIWEPTASKIVAEGIARREASGLDFKEGDAGFLAMRHDMMQARPDIVRAWLEAELDAQLYPCGRQERVEDRRDGGEADDRHGPESPLAVAVRRIRSGPRGVGKERNAFHLYRASQGAGGKCACVPLRDQARVVQGSPQGSDRRLGRSGRPAETRPQRAGWRDQGAAGL